MPYYPAESQKYTYLWSKYRPAILKFMVDAKDGDPQQYKFLSHEFRSINPKEKGGYTFVLRAFKGKSVDDIRKSIVAKDLLTILQQSKRFQELTETSTYEFMLDKGFVLHIKQEVTEPETPEVEVESDNS